MSKTLFILGSGGHGHVVADLCFDLHIYDRISFLDDKYPLELKSCFPSADIVGKLSHVYNLVPHPTLHLLPAFGDNDLRLKWTLRLLSMNFVVPTLIHPTAFVSKQSSLGDGTVVLSNSVVQPFSRCGLTCILNTRSSIDHHVSLGDSVHICPGATVGGTVSIGDLSWIGIGSTVSNNLTLTSSVLVGAGATVITDLPFSGTVVGTPARYLG